MSAITDWIIRTQSMFIFLSSSLSPISPHQQRDLGIGNGFKRLDKATGWQWTQWLGWGWLARRTKKIPEERRGEEGDVVILNEYVYCNIN